MNTFQLNEHREMIEEMIDDGYGITYIAKLLEILPMRLYRWLDRVGIEYRDRDVITASQKVALRIDLHKDKLYCKAWKDFDKLAAKQ